MKLLLMNYSMDPYSQIFSHQRIIALKIAKHFDEIDVITSESVFESKIENINIVSTDWKIGEPLRNAFKFFVIALPLLLKHKNGILFSHMTDVQSALVSLLCRVLRIRHVLWYAHKTPSFFLKLSYPHLDALVTSTAGSCPISGPKIKILGQAIDGSIALIRVRKVNIPPKSWYHIGRIDPSKDIESIIKALELLRIDNPEIDLHFYGLPSSKLNENYYQTLTKKYRESGWITFHGSIPSAQIAEVSGRHDGFIHAFWGSLDKSLVEATMLRRIVVSANPEYLFEFEGLASSNSDVVNELYGQLKSLYKASTISIEAEIERKQQLALANHELSGWVERLVEVLIAKKSCA